MYNILYSSIFLNKIKKNSQKKRSQCSLIRKRTDIVESVIFKGKRKCMCDLVKEREKAVTSHYDIVEVCDCRLEI